MNNKLYHRIKIYCKKHHLFTEGDKVLLAVSGGADSVFLTCFMSELAKEYLLELAMVHVNHGIRGEEADRDEAFCEELAKHHGIPFTAYHGDVIALARSKKMSEEEAARWYRYRCLEEHKEKTGFHKIAVAHHQNDQAETILFQILRGSSLRGAGGIRPERSNIVRPLLGIERAEIVDELRSCRQTWCEDSTNQEINYSRNRLRHKIMPYIEKEIAPGAAVHLAQLGEDLQEIFEYLEEETQKVKERIVQRKPNRIELSVEAFGALHVALQRELMVQLIEELAGSRKDITGRHVKACCELATGESGKRISLPYELQMGKDYQVLWLQSRQLSAEGIASETEAFLQRSGQECPVWEPDKDIQKEYLLEWLDGSSRKFIVKKLPINKEGHRNWKEVPKKSCTKWFDCAKINRMLEFRHPRQGDYFLFGDGKRKLLGRFFIDQKISRDQRERLWVLAMGNHILWIPQLDRVSNAFFVGEQTTEIIEVSYE